jgi:DNA-binding XRE family transcriptional regulator
MAKLTKFQREEIQRKYREHEKNQPALGREYGVSQKTISLIVNGQVLKGLRRKLDAVDKWILRCVKQSEGLSMMDVYRCVNLEAEGNVLGIVCNEQFIRYRINSLEAMGHIYTVRVKGKPAVRRVYLQEQKKFEALTAVIHDGSDPTIRAKTFLTDRSKRP